MSTERRSAIIAGVTGLTGMALLKEILSRDSFSKIKIITRRELQLADPRVEQILIHSLDELKPDDSHFSADIYFCCLGTTIKKAGSWDAFRKVDYDAVVNFAKAAKLSNAKKFVLVSAIGASPESMIIYNRLKGEAENEVIRMQIPGTCIFRPSLLMGDRSEFRFLERLSILGVRKIQNLLPVGLRKKMATEIDRLAFRMVEEALSKESQLQIIEASKI